uniref:Uncharacterized protein n=1 Tax=Syphacia muris TaxID=451379 RepID=A0A0N5AYD9_9BILA
MLRILCAGLASYRKPLLNLYIYNFYGMAKVPRDVVSGRQEFFASEKIFRRHMQLVSQGAQLSESVPKFSDFVTYKLKGLNRAIENANLKHLATSTVNDRKAEELAALTQLRKWILTANEKLVFIEAKFERTLSFDELKNIYRDQQVGLDTCRHSLFVFYFAKLLLGNDSITYCTAVLYFNE